LLVNKLYNRKTKSAKKIKQIPLSIDSSEENVELESEQSEAKLSEKLKATEEVLKEMTEKMEKLQQQRDKVQDELDKVTAELNTAKSQKTMTETKKAETENVLKAEIKTLIGKLMQTKEKIAMNLQVTDSNEKIPLRHQRSISVANSAKSRTNNNSINKKQENTVPTKEVSKEPTDDDTVNNNCSDDLDEYESKQAEEISSQNSSAKKGVDFTKKCMQVLNS